MHTFGNSAPPTLKKEWLPTCLQPRGMAEIDAILNPLFVVAPTIAGGCEERGCKYSSESSPRHFLGGHGFYCSVRSLAHKARQPTVSRRDALNEVTFLFAMM